MSMPPKDNAHILSNQQAFQASYARAREAFGKIEGVLSVGFGLKETSGDYKDNIAIIVFVRKKKSEEDLAPEQRIPRSFEGYQTDVQVIEQGVAEACNNETEYDKIQGGIQISVEDGSGHSKGTLGCIVKKRNDRGRENVYLLTNKHVLYSPGFGAGEYVFHPTHHDQSLGPVQPGLYDNYTYPLSDPSAPKYFIDAATARIDLDSKCCGCTCSHDTTKVDEGMIVDLQVNGVNSLSDVRSVIDDVTIIYTTDNPKKVFKVGRTTGKTTGRVIAVNAALEADPEPDIENGPPISAMNTIKIIFDVSSTSNGKNCNGNVRFTEAGDSGSIIVDENNRVIGLHTHGTSSLASGVIHSYACHILPILDHLALCIPVTTGTSHGSSLATDGSGVAPAVLGDFELPDGEIVFTSQSMASVAAPSTGPFEPVPVSDDELDHMRGLLDVFRATRKGRELHVVFTQVRREVGYLVRNSRPVKLAWHRNKGPAFLAHVLNHLKGETDHIPHEVDGVPLITLLTRMREVLGRYGSHPLRKAMEQHGDELLNMLTLGNCDSVQDCIAYLQEREEV